MPRAQINGIELYYEVHGDGPETVVFAHGAGGNHLSWWQQVPVFARRYRCVTFDHRAFGQSPDVPEGPGGSAFVDDLYGLLEHLGLERVYLVAQSMGGLTALGFTLRYPQRVKALVMADTVLGMRSAVMATLDEAVRQRLEEVRQRRSSEQQPVSSWALGATFQATRPEATFLYQQIAGLNPPRDPNFLAGIDDSEVTAELLARVPMPVLFIVGEEDQLMPPAVIRAAHKLIPNSRMIVVPEAGHSVYFEKPDAFNAVVLDFFASVRSD